MKIFTPVGDLCSGVFGTCLGVLIVSTCPKPSEKSSFDLPTHSGHAQEQCATLFSWNQGQIPYKYRLKIFTPVGDLCSGVFGTCLGVSIVSTCPKPSEKSSFDLPTHSGHAQEQCATLFRWNQGQIPYKSRLKIFTSVGDLCSGVFGTCLGVLIVSTYPKPSEKSSFDLPTHSGHAQEQCATLFRWNQGQIPYKSRLKIFTSVGDLCSGVFGTCLGVSIVSTCPKPSEKSSFDLPTHSGPAQGPRPSQNSWNPGQIPYKSRLKIFTPVGDLCSGVFGTCLGVLIVSTCPTPSEKSSFDLPTHSGLAQGPRPSQNSWNSGQIPYKSRLKIFTPVGDLCSGVFGTCLGVLIVSTCPKPSEKSSFDLPTHSGPAQGPRPSQNSWNPGQIPYKSRLKIFTPVGDLCSGVFGTCLGVLIVSTCPKPSEKSSFDLPTHSGPAQGPRPSQNSWNPGQIPYKSRLKIFTPVGDLCSGVFGTCLGVSIVSTCPKPSEKSSFDLPTHSAEQNLPDFGRIFVYFIGKKIEKIFSANNDKAIRNRRKSGFQKKT